MHECDLQGILPGVECVLPIVQKRKMCLCAFADICLKYL